MPSVRAQVGLGICADCCVEDEAELRSVGHDIRSCAAEKFSKLVYLAGDDIVAVCGY